MFKNIVKVVDMTVVSYSLIEVTDGIPQFIPQPDLHLKGNVPSKKVKKILAEKAGTDAQFVITKLISGRYTLEMTSETFITHATVADFIPANGEPAAAPSSGPAGQEDEDESEDESPDDPSSESESEPEE